MPPDIAKKNLQFIARQLGFDDCRVSAAVPARHADAYKKWLADGCAGDMGWLERNVERRCDPREVVAGAKAVVSLAMNYFPGRDEVFDGFRIARYAWNDDYHDIIDDKLKDIRLAMEDMGGEQRLYTDTGPVLERDFANESGLGWNGKSCMQIHPKMGTWFFLADIITTIDLPPDEPFGDHCGKCNRCMVACPTQAITEPHRVEATRCISYLTIENKGAIPVELRPLIGDRIYGCDTCLDVCPWNRFAKLSRETKFHARHVLDGFQLRDFLQLSHDDFNALFAKSAIRRIKRPSFLRNVCVALGNVGTADDLPALEIAAADENPLISEHASWAVERVRGRR
ncbi:tRNA epoxyqueuosine(34) reductase QueG [Persicirhabdus sediminis]|uniref:tRNA epoxyqueuosine(34) reductase QueG n=1 Tax=Persicirhabdus sediminis TaxID=454144 RepID=A0A8J7MKP1_9BACT|nr:tRNA epoxyqueuosine(34) reductase QueG [Persicirhabdus sediminis]MBK1792793.1 tRNA epoxyqueuosine(34) reductase QueG [Persicirhabdus sediminis]